jgi:predicted RNA-binding protein YlxR (DUF448 family)
MRTGPTRTCLGCRRARPKGWLVRLVRLGSGIVVVDPSAAAAGRGAYVCPEAACVEHALSRGRLAHAFKKPCAPSPDLAAEVQAASDRGAGAPAGEASSGCDMFETGAMAVRA